MSISLATMGKFVQFPAHVVVGGAPARIQEDAPKPTLLVTGVEYLKRKDEDKRPITIIIKDVQ